MTAQLPSSQLKLCETSSFLITHCFQTISSSPSLVFPQPPLSASIPFPCSSSLSTLSFVRFFPVRKCCERCPLAGHQSCLFCDLKCSHALCELVFFPPQMGKPSHWYFWRNLAAVLLSSDEGQDHLFPLGSCMEPMLLYPLTVALPQMVGATERLTIVFPAVREGSWNWTKSSFAVGQYLRSLSSDFHAIMNCRSKKEEFPLPLIFWDLYAAMEDT